MTLPDAELYQPTFSPWLSPEFEKIYTVATARQTLVAPDRVYNIHTLLQQALHLPGDIWECGVYHGGTASVMAALIAESNTKKLLYLFDTFTGLPKPDRERDLHSEGEFGGTDLVEIATFINRPEICRFRPGLLPNTFAGLEGRRIAFAHLDLDLYRSTRDALQFVWPRLSMGGILVIDDYGFPACPGARIAVDEFFAEDRCQPLCLANGQAIVFKGIGVVKPSQL